eukprot:Gb_35243 [translate_table: standard]
MDLIPSLPEEIGRECLLRVSYKSHYNLKAVCRSWEALVNSSRFYHHRKISGVTEQCVCLIQALPQGDSSQDKRHTAPPYGVTAYDPLHGTWERLPPIPDFADGIPLFCQCVSVNHKLVLIGGWHPSNWEPTKFVYVYDFSSAKWRRGSDMPTIRSFFACSVSSGGLIYVAGGHDENKNALRAAEIYNVEEDMWEILPPMIQPRDECQGAFIDGKFYVISGYATEFQGRFEKSAEIFDPRSGIWSKLENMWTVGGCPRPCVSAFGHLYFFHKQEVMKYNAKDNVWSVVDSLPESIRVSPCAAVWREKMFVSGSSCNGGEQACYIFDPQTKADPTSARWVALERAQNFAGFVQSAASLEI